MEEWKKCKEPLCENKAHCKGYCNPHYLQMHRYGHITKKKVVRDQIECIVPLCEKIANCKGYCKAHYLQIYRHGHIIKNRRIVMENVGGDIFTGNGLITDYKEQINLYKLVIGVKNRIRYRHKITDIEETAAKLGIKLPKIPP